MERFSFVVEYSDGSIEDFTASEGDTPEMIHRHVETFLTETLPGSWDKIVIMSPTPTPELLNRLRHLTKAQQRQLLNEWSKALMECRTPPKLP